MTLIKDVVDCSTYSVRGLDNQLIERMNKISPNLLVRIDDLDIELGESVHPWMQSAAKKALEKALGLREEQMIVNSAYRTLAGQMLLRSHFEHHRCGITAAAKPGQSNHNNASAIDIEDSAGWRTSLESCNWKWLGAFDPMHFDCKASGVKSIQGIAVVAFQQLWNLANPKDLIKAVDGVFGPISENKLKNSPAEGFPGLEVPRILKLTQPFQTGADVEALKQALTKAGIAVPSDRTFGSGLDAAVKEFQTQKQLTVDGVVNVSTRQELGLSCYGMV